MVGWPTHWLIVLPAFAFGWLRSSNRATLFKSPESKLLIAYICFIFITTFINEGYLTGREMFMKTLKVGSIFFMLYLIMDGRPKILRTLICLLILGTALGLHAIQQATTGIGWAGVALDPNYTDIRVRWLGVWDGSNGFGLLLGVILPIGIEIVMSHRKSFMRVLSCVSVGIILVSIYFTNSRGSIVAVICGMAFYGFSRLNKKQAVGIFLCLFMVAGVLLPSRMSQLDTDDSSFRERKWAWEQAIRTFKKHPVIGVGKGQYTKHNEQGIQAHNNYIQILAETGVIGYFLFTAFLWFPLKRSFMLQWRNRKKDYTQFNMLRIINTSFVIFLCGTFLIVMENDLIMILLALATCLVKTGIKDSPAIEERIQKIDILGILGCMIIFYAAVWLIAVKEII
jgi:O-antigen ligase